MQIHGFRDSNPVSQGTRKWVRCRFLRMRLVDEVVFVVMGQRFLECGRGIESLGTSNEFRYARSLMPLAEKNTIFVYLSRAFFEGLLSPHYQIELRRRLAAVTDAELMQFSG